MVITKETVEQAYNYACRRICFGDDPHAHLRRPKDQDRFDHGTINLPFRHGIELAIPIELRHNKRDSSHADAGWNFFETEAQRQQTSNWCDRCGNTVFLYDCLHASVALSYNFRFENNRWVRTEIGQLEHDAKQSGDAEAIGKIAMQMETLISTFEPYSGADLICSVPTQEGKDWHLPSELAKQVSTATGKPDVTGWFLFGREKPSITNCSQKEKWDALKSTDFKVNAADGALTNKKVILIDDKYQSGVTLQYVASKLLENGASQVYGLCAVKTMRDDDNDGPPDN